MTIKTLARGLYIDSGQIVPWAFLTYFGAHPSLSVVACNASLIMSALSFSRHKQRSAAGQTLSAFFTKRNVALLILQMLVLTAAVLLWQKSHIASGIAWIVHVFLMERMYGEW